MWRAHKSRIIGQKIRDLRVHWLTTSREPCHRSKKQRPRSKEHAYIQRCYYVSCHATEPSGVDITLPIWDPRNQLARVRASGTPSLLLLDCVEVLLQRARSAFG